MKKTFFLFIVLGLLSACTGTPNDNTTPLSGNAITNMSTDTASGCLIYRNSEYGFSLQYPKEVALLPSFTDSYLLPQAWSTIASPKSSGIQIVSFRTPGSNGIISAELRISASSNRTEIKNCTTAPVYATFKTSTQTIKNTVFTVFEIEDAAMSHYSSIKSYRVFKNTSCMAIEEVITGTNPQVYDPPATEPFTKVEGFKQLDLLLSTLQFDM